MAKVTKMEMFTMLSEMATAADRTDLVEFCQKEMAMLARKSESASSKVSATVQANDALREKILVFLREQSEGVTIKDMCENIPELSGATSQKVSGLLLPLVKSEQVRKEIVKKVTYWYAVA